MNQIKSPIIYIQVTVAALLYNLLPILAWELPLAVRLDWRINVIGGLYYFSCNHQYCPYIREKKIMLILGMIPALWAILFQWFLVYIISSYEEPNGVWWYPLFPIFQGIMIGYSSILTYRGDGGKPDRVCQESDLCRQARGSHSDIPKSNPTQPFCSKLYTLRIRSRTLDDGAV